MSGEPRRRYAAPSEGEEEDSDYNEDREKRIDHNWIRAKQAMIIFSWVILLAVVVTTLIVVTTRIAAAEVTVASNLAAVEDRVKGFVSKSLSDAMAQAMRFGLRG